MFVGQNAILPSILNPKLKTQDSPSDTQEELMRMLQREEMKAVYQGPYLGS